MPRERYCRRERHDGVDGASGRAAGSLPPKERSALLRLELLAGSEPHVPPKPTACGDDEPYSRLQCLDRGDAPHPEEGFAQRDGRNSGRGHHRAPRPQERLGERTD